MPAPSRRNTRGTAVHTLDGRLLLLFLEVYECNSVSRAAERLNLTQSTVSHGLDRLRNALGDPLFVREGRNIVPTARADHLAPQIRDSLTSLEALAEPLVYDPSTDTRVLTIAAHWDELQDELGLIHARIRELAPNMPFRAMALGPVVNARGMLDSGDADIVIMVRSILPAAEIASEHLLTSRMVMYYDPQHRGPIHTTADYGAAQHAVLDFGGNRPSLLAVRLGDMDIQRSVLVYASDLGSLVRMVQGTPLVTTMQHRFRDTIFADLAWCDLPVEIPEIHYDLYWHSRHSLSPRAKWVRAQIHDVFRQTGKGT